MSTQRIQDFGELEPRPIDGFPIDRDRLGLLPLARSEALKIPESDALAVKPIETEIGERALYEVVDSGLAVHRHSDPNNTTVYFTRPGRRFSAPQPGADRHTFIQSIDRDNRTS